MKKLIAVFVFAAAAVSSVSFARAPCYAYCYVPEYIHCVRDGQPREVCRANYEACVDQWGDDPVCQW